MKRFVLISLALCCAASLAAQNITQPGLYDTKGTLVEAQAQPCYVTVSLTVETTTFEPGIYARYAQKLLGKRASLAERKEVKLISATVEQGRHPHTPVHEPAAQPETLESNRFNGRTMTLEEQASSTADLVFSLRKHRLDLVKGEMGEGVFGAGLQAALDEMSRLETDALEMFYGTSRTRTDKYSYIVEVKGDAKDYMVCRYRDDEGVVALDDLAGELVSLHIETEDKTPTSLVAPGPKDKYISEYIVVNRSVCTLCRGAETLDTVDMALLPYAKRVVARTINF